MVIVDLAMMESAFFAAENPERFMLGAHRLKEPFRELKWYLLVAGAMKQ